MVWLKICINNKRVQTCASLVSVLWKHCGLPASLLSNVLCCGLCITFFKCVVLWSARFLNAAHVLSNWWRCFLNLFVFCLFACVILSCSAVALRATSISLNVNEIWYELRQYPVSKHFKTEIKPNFNWIHIKLYSLMDINLNWQKNCFIKVLALSLGKLTEITRKMAHNVKEER